MSSSRVASSTVNSNRSALISGVAAEKMRRSFVESSFHRFFAGGQRWPKSPPVARIKEAAAAVVLSQSTAVLLRLLNVVISE